MTNHNITDADRYRWTRAAWLDGADAIKTLEPIKDRMKAHFESQVKA